MDVLNEKKLVSKTNELLAEMGTLAGQFFTSSEITVQELVISKFGRRAQIKVIVQCDRDEFEEVCPD